MYFVHCTNQILSKFCNKSQGEILGSEKFIRYARFKVVVAFTTLPITITNWTQPNQNFEFLYRYTGSKTFRSKLFSIAYLLWKENISFKLMFNNDGRMTCLIIHSSHIIGKSLASVHRRNKRCNHFGKGQRKWSWWC